MKKLVLLVEDDNIDQMIFRKFYKQSEVDFDLEVVSDGQEAYEFITGPHKTPDFIFMDLNLPKMSGFEVLQKIKCDANSNHKSIPISVLSGSNSESDIQKAYALNANCYLHKEHTYKNGAYFLKAFETFISEYASLPEQGH